MKWDRTTISASEVNRYVYCPYQWYFERYYGRSKLFQMAKTKKAKPKQIKKTTEQKRQSHFARGRAYHAKEYEYLKRKQKIVWIAMTAVLTVCVVLLLYIFMK